MSLNTRLKSYVAYLNCALRPKVSSSGVTEHLSYLVLLPFIFQLPSQLLDNSFYSQSSDEYNYIDTATNGLLSAVRWYTLIDLGVAAAEMDGSSVFLSTCCRTSPLNIGLSLAVVLIQ